MTDIRPGEDVAVTLRVTNHKGEPVSAELSLSLVDQSLVDFTGIEHGSLYQAFYYARSSTVGSYHSYGPSRLLYYPEWGGCGCGGCCGGMLFDEAQPALTARSGSVWQPTLRTDHNGEVTATFRLPTGEVNWQLSVWAATADTQVGEAEFIISTVPQEDLSITSEQPGESEG